jgi:hypothetical protein
LIWLLLRAARSSKKKEKNAMNKVYQHQRKQISSLQRFFLVCSRKLVEGQWWWVGEGAQAHFCSKKTSKV